MSSGRSAWRTVGLVLMAVVALLSTGIVFACDEAADEPASAGVVLMMFLALIGGAWCLVQILNLIARRAGHAL
jgi:hypothetical protein